MSKRYFEGNSNIAVATVLHETENRIFQFVPFWKLPFWPTTIKFNKNKQILLREVQSMITERREQGVMIYRIS